VAPASVFVGVGGVHLSCFDLSHDSLLRQTLRKQPSLEKLLTILLPQLLYERHQLLWLCCDVRHPSRLPLRMDSCSQRRKQCHLQWTSKKQSLIIIKEAFLTPGKVPSIQEVKAHYDFDDVRYISTLGSYLTNFVHYNPVDKIYQLHQYQAPKNVAREAILIDGRRSYLRDFPYDFTKLKPAMNAARVIKDDYEIRMIRRANLISAQAHTNVLKGIRHFENEAEIEAIFVATCVSEQAKEQSYGIIAGSGPNASVLHYGKSLTFLMSSSLLFSWCWW
jgi:hypothetical protein